MVPIEDHPPSYSAVVMTGPLSINLPMCPNSNLLILDDLPPSYEETIIKIKQRY